VVLGFFAHRFFWSPRCLGLFRGWPVFLRAEVRPFCRPLVVQRQGWQQAQSETLIRGLTPRRLFITRGNLSTNTRKILSACYWRAWGPMLRSSACLNAGFVRMWAPHSGFLALLCLQRSEDGRSTRHGVFLDRSDTNTECCSPTNYTNG